MNYRLIIWIDAEARNIGSTNLYNPHTCEMTIPSLRMSMKNDYYGPANNLDEIKLIALDIYSVWKDNGGCVEIVEGDKTIYHISEDSNHQLEDLTII